MKLFNPDNHTRSEEYKRLYALCELAYTVVGFSAAALFVFGSFLFFHESTTYVGIWLFVVGSVLFGLRPTIKLRFPCGTTHNHARPFRFRRRFARRIKSRA